MTDTYYTCKEFGDIFGFSSQSILKAIKQGRIRAFKIGNGRRTHYRIPVSEVLRVEVEGIRELNPNLKDQFKEEE